MPCLQKDHTTCVNSDDRKGKPALQTLLASLNGFNGKHFQSRDIAQALREKRLTVYNR